MKFEEEGAIKLQRQPDFLIYFLIKNDEVVYIGETNNSVARPAAHKDKDYDSYFIITAPEDRKERMKIEKSYINKYRPRYNGMNNYQDYRANQLNLRSYTSLEQFQLYFYNKYNNWKLDIKYIEQVIHSSNVDSVFHENKVLIKRNSMDRLCNALLQKINVKLEQSGVLLDEKAG